ncbi:Josephin-domain-containing protein, partial [Syncephalastrum racemosum]
KGSYFSAVDLATLGQQLDDQERGMMANQGQQYEGHNYDDSGYFSIQQVIQNALSVWNLELIPWQQEVAYICNLDHHWFTLRKFAVPWRWYNLNSTQEAPCYLSETYLGMLLQQTQNENYSIFVVRGTLPVSRADDRALMLPHPNQVAQQKEQEAAFGGKGYSLTSNNDDDHEDEQEDEEVMLARAIEASLQKPAQEKTSLDPMEEMRRKRLARFGN